MMKKLFIILLFALVACNHSPEQKIKTQFLHDRFSRRHQLEVKKVEIYDTLSFFDVTTKMSNFIEEKLILENRLKKMDNFRDSVFKMNAPDSLKYKLLKNGIIRRDFIQRQIDRLYDLAMYYSSARENAIDTIGVYYAKIYTERDTFKVVVSPDDYKILCPVFMFEKDSLTKF